MPGTYDFSRDLFFKGIGATGFIYGAPEVIAHDNNDEFATGTLISTLRAGVATRILTAFKANHDGGYAGIAAALLVGERGHISEKTRETLVSSGLAHLLAISGLHMALVVTFVIFTARAIMATNEYLTLHRPIWHIAIIIGLATGCFYFLLSGGSVSATRAFIMVGIMSVALLFGRRALSLRNVALAALFILVFSPDALLNPGFQMSFAATLVLVAFCRLLVHS